MWSRLSTSMRRKILLLVWILVLVLLFHSQTMHNFAQQIQSKAMATYDWATQVPDQRKLSRLREGFLHNNLKLQAHQVDYILEVTSNVESVLNFQRLYCQNDDKNPFIYGNNLVEFCAHISSRGFSANH